MVAFPIHARHSQNSAGELESEANQLLPAPQRRHRVRVQGRLAVVRSVSTVNLRPSPSALTSPSGTSRSRTTAPTGPRFESGVAGSTVPPVRRRSLDDLGNEREQEFDVNETVVRDCQLRGYGIGGAGNIRRPTEAYGSRKANVSSSAFTKFSSSNPSTTPSGPDKTLWRLRDFLKRTRNYKDKGTRPDSTHVTFVSCPASQAQLQLEDNKRSI
ncbi:uncharacterized protein CTRU02_206704 [Colletotrichum truncatum]|uniref:Uncharacterized protein n=1 Tax=Colletotrichum truncatum TaxID=5467 RepID=A0ACC3Z7P0_COLTU|nr:uncharacterized protein CTRU02_13825 [Colletotrichum truncatum]KAF6782999.1 hypothetical protein CTRU02_13825 [Colletotrichum truncatum]